MAKLVWIAQSQIEKDLREIRFNDPCESEHVFWDREKDEPEYVEWKKYVLIEIEAD